MIPDQNGGAQARGGRQHIGIVGKVRPFDLRFDLGALMADGVEGGARHAQGIGGMGQVFGRNRAGAGFPAAVVIAFGGRKLGAGLRDLRLGAVGAGVKPTHLAHGAGEIGFRRGECDVGR